MATSSARLHGLDFLRALMMSLGVVLHSAQLYLTMPIVDYYWDTARSPSMDATLIFINTFRMPVFFLLSGFFTALFLAKRGTKVTFKNRIDRIVIPFLIFLPILAVIMTFLRVVAHNIMGTGEIGYSLDWIEHPRALWDNTHNLWFLYYLTFHIFTAWLILHVWNKLERGQRHTIVKAFTGKPIHKSLVFFGTCFGLAAIGSLESAGRISADLSFVPQGDVYVYFGLCFFLGWVMFQRLGDLKLLSERWKRDLLTATVLFIIALIFFVLQGEPDAQYYLPAHVMLSLTTGFSIGYYMLGFVGLFSRYFQTYNPWIRYFSDSAYWIFLFHSIPIVIIALLIHDWNVLAEIKFIVVCVGSTFACFVTYQLCVRNGRVGELLNGRRYDTVPWRKG